MSVRNKLKHTVLQLLKQDHVGSFATRHDRRGLILKFAEDVVHLGYKITDIHSVKLDSVKYRYI